MADFKMLDIGYQPPTKKTLLVIDDESALQSLMFDTFADEYRIVPAHNGREGLARAQSEKPDLILLDVMMPDINGLEVLEHLQASPAKSIPVIVTTAKGFDTGMIESLKREPNVKGFLSKPFRIKDLREAVHQAIGGGSAA